MAQPAFNIGKDATLNIVVNGVALKPTLLTEFTFSQDTIELKSRPLNGRPLHRIIPDGWKGTVKYDRADSTLDDFFAQAEDNFWNGGPDAEIFVTQSVKDPNTGVVSQYRFEGVVLKLADGGNYKQEDKVPVSLEWMASARRKIV